MRVSGSFQSRVKTRQPSAQAPLSFDFIADVEIEPAQPTAEAQARRDAEWERFAAWALGIANKTKDIACA